MKLEDQAAYLEELRKIELEKWKEKLIVKDPHFHVDGYSRKIPDPLSFGKGILQGRPKRPGLMLPRTRVKYARQKMTQIVTNVVSRTCFLEILPRK